MISIKRSRGTAPANVAVPIVRMPLSPAFGLEASPLTWSFPRCSDLTEATLTGAWLSIAAAVIMVILLALVSLSHRWPLHMPLSLPFPFLPVLATSRLFYKLPLMTSCLASCYKIVLRSPCFLTSPSQSGALTWAPLSCAQEFGAFLRLETTTELVVDRSPQNELLKINFNIR